MTVLEEVTKLKNQGMSEADIIHNLQQRGVSPREIDDSISQAQIKNAVAGEDAARYSPCWQGARARRGGTEATE